jgi:UDP-N-acetylglucosamine--N-acetylmuramyl-(pentapeptide) pyrophosphoryl-undecaprenol N-acetylglucosamine transferase
VITRAGSTLFEIGLWKTPAIVIPISQSPGDHQKKNAYAFARAGAGIVIEENNLTRNVLSTEVERILGDKSLYADMVQGCEQFAKSDAAARIAQVLIAIGVSHEQ